jgi:hypothetical protein
MSVEVSKPVRGTLTRKRSDGTTETIEMTPEEVRAAPAKYPSHECTNIIVEFDDGSRARPYRCVEIDPPIRYVISKTTGRRSVVF